MLRLTGEQFTTFAKAQGFRFEVIVGGCWLWGNQAVFQNKRLQVTQAVFDCMVDPDTIDATIRSLDIVVLKTVDLSEFMPLTVPSVSNERINRLFGIPDFHLLFPPKSPFKGLHDEDLPFIE